MYSIRIKNLLPVILIFLLGSCAAVKKITQPAAAIRSIKFIGQYEIPYNTAYQNTAVGGLSGIDYDVKNNRYYFICDDRSDKNPARFYTAKIYLHGKGIDSLVFTGVNHLLQANGTVYPNNKQNRFLTPDPEAIRYDPVKRELVWTSEGERIVNEKDTVLINPSVILIHTDGKYIDSFILPGNLHMQVTGSGPRKNSVLEGMSFADNYNSLYVNAEEPLYEDGPQADIEENNAFIRIYKFDVRTRRNTAQYAYKLSPVAYNALPENAFKINGVPDILSLGNNKLLVIERSFSTGRLPCSIKIFIADLEGATDVSNIILNNPAEYKAASKKLLFNMDDLGIYTDNIEGVTFGPILPNGNKTLLFVADNNFNPLEKSQVFLFEITE